MNSGAGGQATLVAARALVVERDWPAAYELLSDADARGELDGEALELLAECARWIGRGERIVELLERAHHAQAGDRQGQLRTSLGLCYTHMDACEPSQAASWWRRADDLISELPEGPEHGLHAWFAGRARGEAGDLAGHEEQAQRALEIGRRYGDRNVEALALIDLAHLATGRGDAPRASEMLNQATALAVAGEIGLLETGIVYCNAIITCRSRGEWDRAEEWTSSASRWVARVRVSYFPGLCRVHRAEVLRIRGELAAAESEALEAVRLLSSAAPRWMAIAYVELGEIRRRRGDLANAFDAFRRALESGWDPQPGFALLVMGQGDPTAAHRALERFHSGRVPTFLCEDRIGIMHARVTVAIAAGELDAAEAVLEGFAPSESGAPWERAVLAQAEGELALARGQESVALERLQSARATWAELDAPYEQATACLLLGRGLAAAGDTLGATLEFEAARGIFDRMGARLDLQRAEALLAELESDARVATVPSSNDDLRVGEGLVRREGDLWSIALDGATVHVKHSKGVVYLARLLAEPGRDQFAIELAGGAAPFSDAGEVLDTAARRAYRERLTDLRVELEQAEEDHDLAKSERCREELDALASQLAAAVGLGGRVRRAGDANERARQSVTKAIGRTIRKLAGIDERLGRHLSNTVRTGVTCRYEPDPGRLVNWRVED